LSREADDEKPNGTERDDRGKGNQGGKGSMWRGKLPKPWILCSSKHAGPLPHPFSWDKATMPENPIQRHGPSHARLIISVWLYLTPIFLIFFLN
jgi:hypothetical protein